MDWVLQGKDSAAVEWAADSEACSHQHDTAEDSDAYKIAMDLLDRCQITYMRVDSKHEFLALHDLTAKEASSLSSDAASFQLRRDI